MRKSKQKSYSIDELESTTGVNRRTISYYSGTGLLPKVGRRGPKTRYAPEYADRLLVIRKAKELQEAGKLPHASLQEIGEVLDRLTPEQLAAAAESDKEVIEIFNQPSPYGDTPSMQALRMPSDPFGESPDDAGSAESWEGGAPEELPSYSSSGKSRSGFFGSNLFSRSSDRARMAERGSDEDFERTTLGAASLADAAEPMEAATGAGSRTVLVPESEITELRQEVAEMRQLVEEEIGGLRKALRELRRLIDRE